ncbi:hypothetical protein ACFL0I_04540 [Gemmatimonadota bacterium]
MKIGSASLLLFLAACSGRDAALVESRFEVTDSAGVQIITNWGPEEEGATRLTVVEDLRLGVVEGEDQAEMFHQVHDLLVDIDGTIFVGNNQTGTVRVFSPEGVFLREFGGRGEGPFEIERLLNDLFWAGDSVVLVDWQGAGKAIVFTKDGEFVTSWRTRTPDWHRIVPMGLGPRGWIANYYLPTSGEQVEPGKPIERERDLWLSVPSADSVGPALYDLPPIVLYGTNAGGKDWPLFQSDRDFALDASGNLFFRDGAEYRIDMFGPDGALRRSIRRDIPLVPISETDIEEYRDLLRRHYDTMTSGDPARRRREVERSLERLDEQAELPRPNTVPPLGRLLVAHSGAVWAERIDQRPLADWWHDRMYRRFDAVPKVATFWDVFSPEGRLLGMVELPPRFNPMAVTDSTVVGVFKDGLDVEFVLRFSIQKQGR